MKVYPITIDLENRVIVKTKIGNSYEENDPSLKVYVAGEHSSHISNIGKIRIIRIISEAEINQSSLSSVLSWYKEDTVWDYAFQPTDFINYGEQLKVGQYVVAHFQNNHNGIINKGHFSFEVQEFKDVESSRSTRDNLTGVQIHRPDNRPFTDGQYLTHIGMLKCRIGDSTHYDEVFDSYEFLKKYQPIMHDIFDCYPRLKEINLIGP